MADTTDYYEILGVDKEADADSIKAAYRKLARRYHPDTSGNAENDETHEKFKELQQAYEVLSDPDKREQYDNRDRFGKTLHDLFRHPRWNRSSMPIGGEDIRSSMQVTLEEVSSGAIKTFPYTRMVNCEACSHSGLKAGASKRRCVPCEGSGFVVQIGFGGRFQMRTMCDRCNGFGAYVASEDACDTCKGSGRTEREESLDISVPQGIGHGDYVIFSGYGNAGINGGQFGSLLVVFLVPPHPVFAREQNDLVVTIPMSFVQLSLGDTITVPTIKNGTVMLIIPPETQSQSRFMIPNCGLYNSKTKHQGNLFVTVTAKVPKDLTDKQKSTLEQFHKLEQEKQHA